MSTIVSGSLAAGKAAPERGPAPTPIGQTRTGSSEEPAPPDRVGAARDTVVQQRSSASPGLVALTTALRGHAQAPAGVLERALSKMRLAVDQLQRGGLEGLASTAVKLMAEKARQAGEEVHGLQDQIGQYFADRKQATLQQQKRVEQRVEAAGKSGFWSSLGKVLKAVSTALGAVAAVASGGVLGIVAATLLVGSLVIAQFDLGEAGRWVQLGLGLAAAALSAGAASGRLASAGSAGAQDAVSAATAKAAEGAGTLLDQAQRLVAVAGRVGSGLASGGGSAAQTVASAFARRQLQAEAALQATDAVAAKRMEQAGEDRDRVGELRDALQRSFTQVLGLLRSDHQLNLAAASGLGPH